MTDNERPIDRLGVPDPSIGTCSDLLPIESESQFSFARKDDEMHVYTDSAALLTRLLHHPELTVTSLRVCGDAGGRCEHPPFGKVVDLGDYEHETMRITGLRGTMPIGCLTVRSSSRKSSSQSRVVSNRVLSGED